MIERVPLINIEVAIVASIIATYLPFYNADGQTLDQTVNKISILKSNPQIKVGEGPSAIAINPTTNKIYVVNSEVDTVSILDSNSGHITDIPHVGPRPIFIDLNEDTNQIYVTNFASDTVSVINATTNNHIKDIPVGENPSFIALNSETGLLYVANSGSGSISVIDTQTNVVMAGITVDINPPNAGRIICDGIDAPTNQYIYIGSETTCLGTPNKGFEFDIWIENLGDNSTRILKTGSIADYILNTFGFGSRDNAATLNITQFGSFSAIFRAVPPPIPSEYWIPIYGVIISTLIGWSIPNIIGWLKSRKQSEE